MLRFIMTDSAKYNKNIEIFTPNEIQHILYEQHTYTIPNIFKEKYKNDSFIEEDFKDNLKILGNYFILMFIEDYSLEPITAKIKFKSKFSSINSPGKYVNSYYEK